MGKGESGFQEERFKKLLRKGIGSRTQKEFARQVNMAPETISRMLNDTGISCPRMKTLEVLASKMSTVTLSELLAACGYQSRKIEDIVKRLESDVDDFFQFQPDHLDIFEDLEDLKKRLLVFLNRNGLSISYHQYSSLDHMAQYWIKGAEESVVFGLEWKYDQYVCFTNFSVYYVNTGKGKILLFGSDIDKPLFADYQPKSQFVHYIQNTAVQTEKVRNVESHLLRSIFGMGKRLPQTYVGCGFYLDGVPEGFEDFFVKHADTFCYSKENILLYNRVLAGEDIREVLGDYESPDNGYGIGGVIGEIMQLESGDPYSYFGPDENLPEEDRNACVMFPFDSNMSEKIGKEQLQYVYQCARELQCEKFGEVYYHTTILEDDRQLFDLDDFY